MSTTVGSFYLRALHIPGGSSRVIAKKNRIISLAGEKEWNVIGVKEKGKDEPGKIG